MRIARLVAAAVAATALVVVTTGGPALAHNSLTKAVPDKNATVKKPPATVELTFLQRVDPKFLTIVVTDAQKQKVPAAAAEADGKKGTLPLTGELANGTYQVAYRVVSEDGHPVQGSYTFTVAAPGVTSASPSVSPDPVVSSPAPAAAPSTVAAADTSDDGPGWALIAAIVAGLLVIGLGALFVARRRS
jgi:copper resistance protein C